MQIPDGFKLAAVHCGLKKMPKLDLGMIYCQDFARVVGFFTKNVNPSYSVTVCKKHIKNPVKAVLVNSGNANCFSHKRGLADTESIVEKLAKELNVNRENILIASTGIVGKKLSKEKIIAAFPALKAGLGENRDKFATSIMTTDTFPKIAYAPMATVQGKGSILGFAKGAGMIAPNMATLLSFVLTDIAISKSLLKKITFRAVEKSFNSITIDGCMSTNDTLLILSSNKRGLSKNKEEEFAKKIEDVLLSLAKMIVRDAEGATKFVTIEVRGARTEREAKHAGMYIANSNLVKCALYGQDPNWGRVIAALGHAGIKVDENISISATSLKNREIDIVVNLKHGNSSWKVYTSDLTPKYVAINADYN